MTLSGHDSLTTYTDSYNRGHDLPDVFHKAVVYFFAPPVVESFLNGKALWADARIHRREWCRSVDQAKKKRFALGKSLVSVKHGILTTPVPKSEMSEMVGS